MPRALLPKRLADSSIICSCSPYRLRDCVAWQPRCCGVGSRRELASKPQLETSYQPATNLDALPVEQVVLRLLHSCRGRAAGTRRRWQRVRQPGAVATHGDIQCAADRAWRLPPIAPAPHARCRKRCAGGPTDQGLPARRATHTPQLCAGRVQAEDGGRRAGTHPAPRGPAGRPPPRPPQSAPGTTRWCPSRRPGPCQEPVQGQACAHNSSARAATLQALPADEGRREGLSAAQRDGQAPSMRCARQPRDQASPGRQGLPPAQPTQFIARTVSSTGVSGSGRWQ